MAARKQPVCQFRTHEAVKMTKNGDGARGRRGQALRHAAAIGVRSVRGAQAFDAARQLLGLGQFQTQILVGSEREEANRVTSCPRARRERASRWVCISSPPAKGSAIGYLR